MKYLLQYKELVAMRRLLWLLSLVCLSACVSDTQKAMGLVQQAGWKWNIIHTEIFDLASASSPNRHSAVLWIYIEGDGFAYVNPSQASSDPTPSVPLALRLALKHPPSVSVAYLARPCQYILQNECSQKYWTNARYSAEVVDSLNRAITALKKRTGASKLVLAGYSGGGVLAVLIAAKRNDVTKIVTVAANLDLAYWTKKNRLAPLTGSINPVDVAEKVAQIPQLHFTGTEDDVVSTDIAQSFVHHLPPDAPVQLIEVPNYTHYCCWEKNWAEYMTLQ